MWETLVRGQSQFIILLKQIHWYIHKYLCVSLRSTHAPRVPLPKSGKFLLFAFISRATLDRSRTMVEAPARAAVLQPRSPKVNHAVGEGGGH